MYFSSLLCSDACDLTLDPNTAHVKLSLSEDNRKVTYAKEKQPYPDHADRFEHQEQVLCKQSLTGHCYWEVEWSGMVNVAVTYKTVSRKGGTESWFGYNDKSWSLYCTHNRYTAWHNCMKTDIPVLSPLSNRVGVYLDVSAGTLSFYIVSDTHTLTHLHTFNTTFTEPLYAGFRAHESSLTLCKIE
uniref:B30.2/SPRY domain-containing protein n=1 Tax=Sinocyclocheilus rhinocerous TaxID=307959 RepID=A0A673HRH6_9TELE